MSHIFTENIRAAQEAGDMRKIHNLLFFGILPCRNSEE